MSIINFNDVISTVKKVEETKKSFLENQYNNLSQEDKIKLDNQFEAEAEQAEANEEEL